MSLENTAEHVQLVHPEWHPLIDGEDPVNQLKSTGDFFYLEPPTETAVDTTETAVDTTETVFETSNEAIRVNSSPKSTILNNKNWSNDMKASFNVMV